MPYNCALIATYARLACDTDKFAYNKIVALGIKKNPTKDFSLVGTWIYADAEALDADVEVIPDVQGEYDGSSPEVSNDAFGAKLEQITSRKHKITFEVEYNSKNWAFFNALGQSRNYGIVAVTGNFEELYDSGKQECTFVVKTPITKEIDKIKKYMVEVSWSNMDLLKPVAVDQEQIDLFR